MTEDKPNYQSYVLRLWVVREGEREVWRASLQAIPGSERRGFVNLQALLAFLEGQTRPPDSPRPANGAG